MRGPREPVSVSSLSHTLRLRLRRMICTLHALALLILPICALSSPAPADTQALIRDLGLIESPVPVREHPRWQPPQRIVVRIEAGDDMLPALREVAPDATFITVTSVAEAVAAADQADVILGYCLPEVIAAAPRLRWIQSYFAGVERCTNEPALREGRVLLTNMQRVAGPVMAEHAMALLLALARNLDRSIVHQQQKVWARTDMDAARGDQAYRWKQLQGDTLLVVGLGGIGTEVARRAHAFGMTVIATRASDRPAPAFVSYVGKPAELLSLAARSDAVVSALPLTAATRGVFDAKFFAAMKPGGFFINVGRGASVVQSELIAALKSGQLAGAGLDVTDPEPLPSDDPLWIAPNLIITPHVSSETGRGEAARWTILRENLRRYVAGEPLLSVVDPARGY